MVKILHSADLHLDSPLRNLERYEGCPADAVRQASRRAMDNLVRVALDEAVQVVLLAGDIFDGDWQDYNSGLFLNTRLSRLGEAGIRVVMVAGNHDAMSRITKDLRPPENVRRCGAKHAETIRFEDLGLAVHGQSYATPKETRDLASGFPIALPGLVNVGLLHTALTGREGHEPYAPCTLETLRAKGYDYWALGHVHAREKVCADPPVVFPGNIQGRHARETGPKGCCLVEFTHQGHARTRFIDLDVLRWHELTVDIAGATDEGVVLDRARQGLHLLAAEAPERLWAVRVVLQGRGSAHDILAATPERWINEIRNAAVEAGSERIWIERVLLHSAAPTRRPASPAGALAELEELFEEAARQPQRLAGHLAPFQDKIRADLAETDLARSVTDHDWLLARIAEARALLEQRLGHGEDA